MKRRVGDTLVEVTLAIGIFSMVAIAVVAVMTSGTSNAQTTLETTLAREEIDTQAEAIRFIHSAYVASLSNDSADAYVQLWDKITQRAIDPESYSGYLDYSPQTCQEVEKSTTLKSYGFVINPRKLSSDPVNAYIKYNKNIFKSASTYPRLIYNQNEAEGTDSLIDASTDTNLYRAEGIYVIAVKDSGTQIVGETSPTAGTGFYDFYIRTCWYGSGSSNPSSISTVIRLYNPQDVIDRYTTPTVKINFIKNGGDGVMNSITVKAGETITIPPSSFTNPGLSFLKWNTAEDGTGVTYNPGSKYTVPSSMSNFQVLNLYAIWNKYKINYNTNGGTLIATTYCTSVQNCYISSNKPSRAGYYFKGWATSSGSSTVTYNPGGKIVPTSSNTTLYAVWGRYEISYNANGGSGAPSTTYCATTTNCTLSSTEPTRSDYVFKGWATSSTATTASYSAGQQFTPTSNKTTLYAVWGTRNETITIRAEWTNRVDYDSYLKLQKPDGSNYLNATYSTTNLTTTYNGASYTYLTGIGDGQSKTRYEQFVINTISGRSVYYSIRKYSKGNVSNDITITVSGQYLGTRTFYSKDKKCTGNYWNVFSYKDGVITERNTCSGSMQFGY